MTIDKVIELAKQLGIEFDLSEGLPAFWMELGELQRFAELVRADALEECANLCDVFGTPESPRLAQNDEQWGASMCATRIRSLI